MNYGTNGGFLDNFSSVPNERSRVAMLSFGMTPALADSAEAEYAAEKERAVTLLAAEFRALDQAVVRGNGASVRSVQLEKLPEDSMTGRELDQLDEVFNSGNVAPHATGPRAFGLTATPVSVETEFARQSFKECLNAEIPKIFGPDIIKRAYNKEVRQALKSKQWKKASAILVQNIKKKFGKEVARLFVKKLAAKALPGGLPAQIAIATGKCAAKKIWPW